MSKQGTGLVKACEQYLALAGFVAWRQNCGAVKVGKRYIRLGPAGLPDLMLLLPAHGVYPPGRLAGVECKMGKGRLSITQKVVQMNLTSAGALVLTVRSVDDLQKALRAEGVPCP